MSISLATGHKEQMSKAEVMTAATALHGSKKGIFDLRQRLYRLDFPYQQCFALLAGDANTISNAGAQHEGRLSITRVSQSCHAVLLAKNLLPQTVVKALASVGLLKLEFPLHHVQIPARRIQQWLALVEEEAPYTHPITADDLNAALEAFGVPPPLFGDASLAN